MKQQRDTDLIALVGFNGRYDNLGDVVICDLLVNELFKYVKIYFIGPGLKIKGVGQIKDKLKIFYYLYFLFARKKIYFFSSPGGPVFKGNSQQRKNQIKSFIVRILRIVNKKYFLFSSITFYGDTKPYVPSELDDYDVLSLRDSYSYEVCCKLYGDKKKIYHSTDVSFALKYVDKAFSDKIESIALSFREYIPEDDCDLDVFDFVEFITTKIKYDYKKPHVFTLAQVKEDLLMSKKISEKFRVEDLGLINSSNWSDCYDNIDVIFTNRLHVALLSASRGVLPIIYTSKNHIKLISLFTDVGLSDLLITSIKDASDVNKIIDRRQAILTQIKEVFRSERDIILNQVYKCFY